jgi:adenine/guanine phosphoribosyltransferase-like PRPP-binding protein
VQEDHDRRVRVALVDDVHAQGGTLAVGHRHVVRGEREAREVGEAVVGSPEGQHDPFLARGAVRPPEFPLLS